MNFRLATLHDLPQIKSMYQEIVKSMEEHQIQIWDDVYPCDFFEEDIRHQRLYLMLENTKIISAFALCDSNSGANEVRWENCCGKALYLDRLGVNVRHTRQGIGSLTLIKAKETAKALGSAYLRLFVVDINVPAIRLYTKNGFTKAEGFYDEVIDETSTLHEFGYEIKL